MALAMLRDCLLLHTGQGILHVLGRIMPVQVVPLDHTVLVGKAGVQRVFELSKI